MALVHFFPVILLVAVWRLGGAEVPCPVDGVKGHQPQETTLEGKVLLAIFVSGVFLFFLAEISFTTKACSPYSTAKCGCPGWTFFCRKNNPFPDEEVMLPVGLQSLFNSQTWLSRMHSMISFLWGRKPLKVMYKPLDTLLKTAHEEIRDEVFMEEEEEEEEAAVHHWDNARLCFLEPPEEATSSRER
ncbi:UNVERIFIED_CONTAM: hypothetical protein K2H54_011983 [Gekko kuhli]